MSSNNRPSNAPPPPGSQGEAPTAMPSWLDYLQHVPYLNVPPGALQQHTAPFGHHPLDPMFAAMVALGYNRLAQAYVQPEPVSAQQQQYQQQYLQQQYLQQFLQQQQQQQHANQHSMPYHHQDTRRHGAQSIRRFGNASALYPSSSPPLPSAASATAHAALAPPLTPPPPLLTPFSASRASAPHAHTKSTIAHAHTHTTKKRPAQTAPPLLRGLPLPRRLRHSAPSTLAPPTPTTVTPPTTATTTTRPPETTAAVHSPLRLPPPPLVIKPTPKKWIAPPASAPAAAAIGVMQAHTHTETHPNMSKNSPAAAAQDKQEEEEEEGQEKEKIPLLGEKGAVLVFPFAEPTETKVVLPSSSRAVSEMVDYWTLFGNKTRRLVTTTDLTDWTPQMLSCELLPGRKGPPTGLQLVEQRSEEYSRIERAFWRTLSAGGPGGGARQHRLLSVLRVQAPEQVEKYCMHRAHVLLEEDTADDIPADSLSLEEKKLWHGPSTVEALRNILVRGFDRSMSTTSAWGKGVHFTSHLLQAERSAAPAFSAIDGRVVKVVVLAKVCVGDVCVGSQDMYPPPLKPGSTRAYNSTVDSVENPTVCVTYADAQARPLYVCTFLSPTEEEEEA